MSTEQAYENPVKCYWRFGQHRVGHIGGSVFFGWEWSAHGLGVIRSTPWGAWWAWRQFYRDWRRNPRAFIGEEP